MDFIKKMGKANALLLVLCAAIIVVAEYLFLTGNEMHGLFIGLWAPMVLGLMIFFKLVQNGRE